MQHLLECSLGCCGRWGGIEHDLEALLGWSKGALMERGELCNQPRTVRRAALIFSYSNQCSNMGFTFQPEKAWSFCENSVLPNGHKGLPADSCRGNAPLGPIRSLVACKHAKTQNRQNRALFSPKLSSVEQVSE